MINNQYALTSMCKFFIQHWWLEACKSVGTEGIECELGPNTISLPLFTEYSPPSYRDHCTVEHAGNLCCAGAEIQVSVLAVYLSWIFE